MYSALLQLSSFKLSSAAWLLRNRFLLLVLALSLLAPLPRFFGSVAYISNCCNHPSTVNVFDTSNGEQSAQWKVGLNAYGAVYSPDGTKVYVSNSNSHTVSVIRAATGVTLATIPAGFSEEAVAISADGSRVYVSSYEYAYLSHIVAIDTATDSIAGVMTFSGAVLAGLAVSPDGSRLYTNVLDFGGSRVSGLVAIDTQSFIVKRVNSVSGVDVAVTPDGKLLYVTVQGLAGGPGNVTVIRAATNQVVTTIPLPANVYPGFVKITPNGREAWVDEAPLVNGASPLIVVISTSTYQTSTIRLPASSSPGRILFSPDSKKAYVVDGGALVDVLSVPLRALVSRIASAGIVAQPALSPDGATLAVPNSGTADTAVVKTSDGNTLASVPIGAIDYGNQLYLEYGGLAVSHDGTLAYATNFASGSVSVIDTASKTVIHNVPVGSEPVAVAVSPNTSAVYVANSFSNSVTVIHTGTFRTQTIALPSSKYGYPSSIAVAPDGKHVYVAVNNAQPDFGNAPCWILGIDTSTLQVVSATRIFYPMALTVSPDGTAVYVVGGLSDTLYTISITTNQITHAVALTNGGPTQPVTGGIAVTPDGTRVFASDGSSSTVFEVDVINHKLIRQIKAGQTAGNIAITPDGSEAWVTDYVGTAVHVINVGSGNVTRSIGLRNQSYGIAFGPQ
jgi:YVTN family beta-propeller protein